jgi:hypothetical protein
MITALKAFQIIRDTLGGFLSQNDDDKTALFIASLIDSLDRDIESDHNETRKTIDRLNIKNIDLQNLVAIHEYQKEDLLNAQKLLKAVNDELKLECTNLREEISTLRNDLDDCDCGQ